MRKTPRAITGLWRKPSHSVEPFWLSQIPPAKMGIERRKTMKLSIPTRLLLQRTSYCPSVWLLQTRRAMPIHVRKCHKLDQDGRNTTKSRLPKLGQRTKQALLRLPILQGGSSRQRQERMEESCSSQHHLPCLPYHCLLCWLLCFKEQQERWQLWLWI